MRGCISSMNSVDKQGNNETEPNYRVCSICGKEFDTPAEASKHMTIEHMQKGEIPQ
jgi:hypothetical protein